MRAKSELSSRNSLNLRDNLLFTFNFSEEEHQDFKEINSTTKIARDNFIENTISMN